MRILRKKRVLLTEKIIETTFNILFILFFKEYTFHLVSLYLTPRAKVSLLSESKICFISGFHGASSHLSNANTVH